MRFRLHVGWDSGECWPVDLDRVVAEALESDILGCDERMPERAMVMCPGFVVGFFESSLR